MRRAQDRARSTRFRKNEARSATIESRAQGALKLAREARNENVPAKRADFLIFFYFCFFYDNNIYFPFALSASLCVLLKVLVLFLIWLCFYNQSVV